MIEAADRKTSDAASDVAAIAKITPEAKRALTEAESRRTNRQLGQPTRPREINGRLGPEPVRYGDWENKGIISDF